MHTPQPSPEDFGHNLYRHERGGRRVLIGTVRTIRAYPAEEADLAAFEARINRMIERLYADFGVESVYTDFERRAGKHYSCTVTVRWVADPAAPAAVAIEVGGRTPATGATIPLDGRLAA